MIYPKKHSFGASVGTLAAALFCQVSPARAAIIDGLTEYWDLDGDYSATVDTNHVGTLVTTGTGSGTFVSGKFGQAIDLENSASNQAYIEIGGDVADFDLNANMTVSVWYTTESLYTNWQTVIGKSDGSWRIARASSSTTGLTFEGRKPHDVPAFLDVPGWHHVAVTVDRTAELNTVYIDGAVAGTHSPGSTFGTNSFRMQIGGNPQASGRGWDGNIDDVALWDRALTPAEISSIWNDGDGASIASLTIPEPTSIVLCGLGGFALMLRQRRR